MPVSSSLQVRGARVGMILSPRWGLGTIRWIWCWLLLVTLFAAQCSRADVLRPPARIPGPQSRPSASSSSSSSTTTTTTTSSFSSNRNMKPNPTRFQRQPLQPTGMGLPGLHHQRPGYNPTNRNNPGQQASILRLMTKTYLYLQILPNGTVSATGYESSYYCKYTYNPIINIIHTSINVPSVDSHLVRRCSRLMSIQFECMLNVNAALHLGIFKWYIQF